MGWQRQSGVSEPAKKETGKPEGFPTKLRRKGVTFVDGRKKSAVRRVSASFSQVAKLGRQNLATGVTINQRILEVNDF